MVSKALSINDGPIEKIDPFQESVNLLLVIAFQKSSSANFPIALTLARSSQRFAIADVGGRLMYVAGFSKTQADAGKAAAFLGYANSWKGVMVFANGALLPNTSKLSMVIDCYLQSCACRDPRAHCQRIVDDPFFTRETSPYAGIIQQSIVQKTENVPQYAFPCKLLQPSMRFQKLVSASACDQIQAASVKFGCNICPRFNPDDFPIVGTTKITYYTGIN